ncbi:hypothetical protein [Thalassovita sp.]|uniref:hypothetical protein n=1 Tax=Thalassovita sp. TaxID=1979401 RepID=UPI002880FF72|nr:hypothetical protein [Thalassovita sp.]MDF1801723.1 hypothetical protein [Thalassovita sp.]
MPHYRSEIRAKFRGALSASSRFESFGSVRLWAKSLDYKSLPVLAVGIPRELNERSVLEETTRTISVIVAIKRLGGDDLEDVLDEDSAEVERVVMAAFDPGAIDLTETSFAEDASGEQCVGTLTMTFAVPTYLVDPLT